MSILQLILSDDTNCFKNGFAFFVSMAKHQILEAAIEAFMASSSTLLELLDLGCILGILEGANGVLVDTVGNHVLPCWILPLSPFGAWNMVRSGHGTWVQTSDPGKLIVMD